MLIYSSIAKNDLTFLFKRCDFQLSSQQKSTTTLSHPPPKRECTSILMTLPADYAPSAGTAGTSEYELKAFSRSPFSIAAINLGDGRKMSNTRGPESGSFRKNMFFQVFSGRMLWRCLAYSNVSVLIPRMQLNIR